MRALLVILILVVVAVLAAIATGFLDVGAFGGEAPEITAGKNGVSASAGTPPAFDVETGSVKVGSKETTVNVPTPTIEIQKAGHKPAAAPTNSAQ